MKTSGGLISGRGLKISVLNRWLLGTPIATSINNQIEKFSNVFNNASEQHVDQRDSGIKIDFEHSDTITTWLKTHYPFPELNELMSLSTGVVGDDKVNCYKAEQVGEQIVCSIIGENVSDVKLKRMNRVVSLDYSNKTSIFIRDDIIPIDPLLLFQRIMLKVKSDEELKEYFKYELAPMSLSFFDETGQMRKTKKSILYDIFPSSPNIF